MTHSIFTDIVDQGLCVGCGACAAFQPKVLKMEWNDHGFYAPVLRADATAEPSPRTLRVCPFSDDGANENTLGEARFAVHQRADFHDAVGYYLQCYIGHCGNSEIRERATSGGIIAWMIRYALSERLVDRVIALGDSRRPDRLFDFNSYESIADLDAAMKSRYFPSEFSEAARDIVDTPGTALFVGLPCQIKALRKLAVEEPELARKLKYTVSLFCGHQKSRHYVDYLALHLGIDPASVVSIDFRKKRPGAPANAYGFEVTFRNGQGTSVAAGITRDVFASSWSNNIFMNPACEFCDDVVGETADMSVGDAWLPGYSQDWRGTSIFVVRHPDLRKAVDEAMRDGQLTGEEITPHIVYRSQEGAFRQRRDALQYRLALAAKSGRVAPRKRVEPSLSAIGFLDRCQQRLRIRMREISNSTFALSSTERSVGAFRRRAAITAALSQALVHLRRIKRRLQAKLARQRAQT